MQVSIVVVRVWHGVVVGVYGTVLSGRRESIGATSLKFRFEEKRTLFDIGEWARRRGHTKN